MHTPYTRAAVCRHSSHPTVFTLLLLLVLCCTVGCLAAVPRGCMHDKINRMNRPTAVVREIPRTGEGAVQAYTASAASNTDSSKDGKKWAPIRIKAFTRDMDDPSRYCTKAGDIRVDQFFRTVRCHAGGVLTVRKKRAIVERIIPAAIKMHAERLSVVPLTGTVKVPRTDIRSCSNFTIPEEHHTIGLQNADLYLYVGAMQDDRAAAWAMICGTLPDNRPFIAAINVNPDGLRSTNSVVRVVAHEIGHTLGFSSSFFPRLGMVESLKDVRGREYVLVIKTSKAKEVARKYYNCSTAPGLELQTAGWGSGSHFSSRNMKGELMGTGLAPMVYGELTLAVFDSMPFYKANFSMAEPTIWGRNAGCDFLNKKCVENGVSRIPEFFCNETRSSDMYFCRPDRTGFGYCTLMAHYKYIPTEFRYFSKEYLGGDLGDMDYCPYVEPYPGATCTSGTTLISRGSFIGENARCVKGVDLRFSGKPVGDVCVNTNCDHTKKEVSVQFLGGKWQKCEEKKEIIPDNGQLTGKIICPRYDEVCIKHPDITLALKYLPKQNDDQLAAPANITWKRTEPQSPSPQPTTPTPPSAADEEKLSENGGGIGGHISEDAGTHGSITQTIPTTDTTVVERTKMDDSHIQDSHVVAGSHGSATQNTPTNTHDGPNGDAEGNLDINVNSGTVNEPNPNAGLNLYMGIGDGSIPAAGHASLLPLILAVAVAVAVSL